MFPPIFRMVAWSNLYTWCMNLEFMQMSVTRKKLKNIQSSSSRVVHDPYALNLWHSTITVNDRYENLLKNRQPWKRIPSKGTEIDICSQNFCQQRFASSFDSFKTCPYTSSNLTFLQSLSFNLANMSRRDPTGKFLRSLTFAEKKCTKCRGGGCWIFIGWHEELDFKYWFKIL